MSSVDFKNVQYGENGNAEPYRDPELENALEQAKVYAPEIPDITFENLTGYAQKGYSHTDEILKADAALLGRKIEIRA